MSSYRTAVLFYGLPSTGYCQQKRKKKKKKKKKKRERKNEKPDQHRPGSAFFRGTISSGNLATGSHPSSSIVKRVWEGWGSLRGKGNLLAGAQKVPFPPQKTSALQPIPVPPARTMPGGRPPARPSCSWCRWP